MYDQVRNTAREVLMSENKRPEILDILETEYGFAVFDGSSDYDLNIIGVRNPHSKEAGSYDDQLVVCYKVGGKWKEERFSCTTDPGLYWLHNAKMNSGGCAIVKHPQQMRGAYSIGLHRGQYECLKQMRPVEFWRDENRDNKADYSGPIYKGLIGVNIHRSSAWRDTKDEPVGRYSAGCTVLSKPEDLARLLWLCRKQIEVNNWQRFTYTLVMGDY